MEHQPESDAMSPENMLNHDHISTQNVARRRSSYVLPVSSLVSYADSESESEESLHPNMYCRQGGTTDGKRKAKGRTNSIIINATQSSSVSAQFLSQTESILYPRLHSQKSGNATAWTTPNAFQESLSGASYLLNQYDNHLRLLKRGRYRYTYDDGTESEEITEGRGIKLPPPSHVASVSGIAGIMTNGNAKASAHIMSDPSKAAYAELVELLRCCSDTEAVEILSLLARGVNVTTLITQIQSGDLLTQISLAPEVIRQYEFPYAREMPGHLFTASNPYVSSVLFQSIFHSESDNATSVQQAQHRRKQLRFGEDFRDNRPSAEHHTKRPAQYMIPYHIAEMADPRIGLIAARPWTRVISNDHLFRKLISSYFQFLHPCGPFVHIDLFLDDMVAGRSEFCSPLLVNAMLIIGSQACRDIPDRSKIWHPQTLPNKFMAEARRLWNIEYVKGSKITTVQSANLLGYVSLNNGMEVIGNYYMRRACEMATEMQLFDVGMEHEDTDMGKARLYTAWTLFTWQALYTYSFRYPPLIEDPPQTPLPDAHTKPQWYGEIWLQYPHEQPIHAMYIGPKLQAEGAMCAIKNRMCLMRFSHVNGLQPVAKDVIISLLRSLDNWLKTLPHTLQARHVVFPSHLDLHIQFLHFRTEILQLIIDSEHAHDPAVLSIFDPQTLQSVQKECQNHLETVFRLYYARHSGEIYDPWITLACTAIGHLALDNLKTDVVADAVSIAINRTALILAAQCLYLQSKVFHIGSLLGLALEEAMNPEELQLVQTYCRAPLIDDSDKVLIREHADCMLSVPDLRRFCDDPDTIRLRTMIKGP